jgi:hypothetical protein
MHLVYKITLEKRKQEGIMPFLYIGSKSNALFENGTILDKNKTPYYGSSSYKDYQEIVESDRVTVEIIKEFEKYVDALNFESALQKSLDVVADPSFFNLSIATINNFTDPNYATYKHVKTGKTVRLERNHPMVISGDYVGVSKGTILSEEDKKKRSRSGNQNGFYGKTHSPETVNKILESRDKTYTENPERFLEIREKMSKTAKKTFAGVPKSEDHKKKIGRKGLVMLKNKITGKTIRVPRDDRGNYDKEIWSNPASLSDNKSQAGSKWITNGFENKKIRKDDEKPVGWEYGRTYNGWNKLKGSKNENS